MTIKVCVIIVLFGLLTTGCGQNKSVNNETENNLGNFRETERNTSIYGNYVDDAYAKRNEGYDWVAVMVKELPDDKIMISVRSRADQKRPTCTFDAEAFKKNDNTYEVIYNGKPIHFVFNQNQLEIRSPQPQDDTVLYFFCSGGASLAGKYTKINEELDKNQIDRTSFFRILELQSVGFNVSSIEEEEKNKMTVFTFGLENRFDETFDITGYKILNAEVEDLNADDSPELIVYTQKQDEMERGKVWAFSVNNGKSMSMVYIEPTAQNKKVNQGYRGFDEFTLVENYLVQRFPVFKENDKTENPTGGIRQVSYKLIEGEALRKLEVDKISNY